MLKVINISKSFGLQTLFDSASFSINPGERVGLVGRNGHGKTTLFRMLIGEEHPDSGEISVPRGYRLGHVAQQLDFTQNSVLDEACLGLQEHEKDERWKAEKILFGLGFTATDMSRPPGEFSGGFQVRLNLAKVLISEPQMLLLDEPTNYLDIVSIRWLSQFLRQWQGELMLITHDRSFMDDVVTHTIGIHRQRVRKVTGNTEKLYDQILKEEEIHEKTRINDEKKRKEVELFITRFRAKARLAGLVQSRVKALDKNEKLDRLEKIKNLEFSFNYKPFNAKTLSKIEGLTFSYTADTPPLINDFSLSIAAHDRICIIGKNGRGKSTLLKLLAGELTPLKGTTISHPNLSTGYFAQTNIHVLNDNMTVEEEVVSAGTDRQTARNICGGMMFEGDNALKKISVLSGGEKSRVLLAKILATPANMLLLDEPTNHLDMESCDALLAAIDSFDGAVIIVTHNEMFLNSLANRFVVFQSTGARVFDGTYHSFLEKVGWEEEQAAERPGTASDTAAPAAGPVNKKEIRKLRAQLMTERSRALKPLEDAVAVIEDEIIAREDELDVLHKQIIDESARGTGSKIGELSKQVKTIQARIDGLYNELEHKTRELEERKKVFDAEMASLE